METEKYIQIMDDYRITADNLNIVLQEKYEKKDGKGKNANGTGEYDWRDVSYHQNFKSLANSLIKKEVNNSIKASQELNEIDTMMNNLVSQIHNHLSDKVILNRGKKDE